MKRILIIDDEPDVLNSLKTLYEMCNYEVHTVSDAEDVANMLLHNLSLIIIDIKLKGADGRMICKVLNESPLYKHIPIIMMSGRLKGNSLETYGCKAEAFVEKPYSAEEMEMLARKLAIAS